ncbi:hypothetical protein QJS04_geneDACA001510 [Acorus gramineus]|uniref:RING-type domain-containing protein n=1 Tax=Acorus gramineus TaxID=55184 RepID=A0AAV9BGS7_ACOGR|nr:hypothetical protein QJS04_geneDACA001510 [Acorus gramineus]
MVCGLCMKLLRRRLPCLLDDAITSNNLPVVAILFCGHVFHAECLEQTTPEVNTQDPPCPSCNANGRLFYAISEGEEV